LYRYVIRDTHWYFYFEGRKINAKNRGEGIGGVSKNEGGRFATALIFDILETMSKKILVSGIQSSGKLHIGNYFGAMKQNIELSNSGDYESYIFLADYHSMTTLTDAKERIQNTIDAVATYIACGLDVSKVVLFKQSDVPVHAELSWILNTVTPMPMLMLAHSFKDKIKFQHKMDGRVIEDNNMEISHQLNELKHFGHPDTFGKLEESFWVDVSELRKVNSGLLTYPVLMAADILMYNADIVPVGADQRQHLEMTREIAGKFNRAYTTELFTMPQAYIVEEVATIPGIDGTKMSKSKNNHIPLFCSDEELKKRVMSIVTDSATPSEKKNPDENNIYNIHKIFLTKEEDSRLRVKFEGCDVEHPYGYKQAKDELLATLMKWREGKKEIYDDLIVHPEKIKTILKEGGKVAKAKAETKMEEVRKIVGLSF
jgi:tryptophanyl-tRNA synthetase